MSADRSFHSLPPNFSEKYIEPYKNAPWFILLHDTPRVDKTIRSTNAEKGEIFQYDPAATREAEKNSEKPRKHSKPKKIIMGAIDSKKVKVEWAPSLFAPLSERDKDLLIAIDSLKSRISIFNDPSDYLSFGHELKVGDMVQVSSSVLAKSQKDDVHGELKFKGPMMSSRGFEPKGTYFGVQLAAKCGSSNGVFKGTVYFRCGVDYGVFVPINKLVPYSKQKKSKQDKEVPCTRSSHHVGDTSKEPYFYKEGDKVEVLTTLKKPPRKDWIKGRVVTCKSHDGKLLIGVEVAQHHELAINTNGMYMGKSLFSPNNPAHTVLVEIFDVQPCQAAEKEYEDKNPSTKSHVPGNGHLQQSHANKDVKATSSTRRKDNSSKNDPKDEDRVHSDRVISYSGSNTQHKDKASSEQQGFHTGEAGAQSHTTQENIKHIAKEVDRSARFPGRETDSSTQVGNILDKTQQEMQTNLSKSSPTFPVVKQPPSNGMNFYEDHYNEKLGSKNNPMTHSVRNFEEQKQGKHNEQGKGFFSSIAASLSFRTVEQPPFRLDQWELGQISIGGEKLLKILAHDLQIKEADKIFRKKMKDFETTCQLLRQWWEQLHEGHEAAFEELKNSLKENEFGELVYFMEGGEPTDGEFHSSIIEVVLFKFKNRLSVLADKLRVTITAEELPESVLGEQIFNIWQKRHPGTEKLSQLVHAIEEISKEILKTGQREQMSVRKAEELEDLAHELEQGLSENIIRSISSTVPQGEWYQFGYSLGLSQLRLNAMERKFISRDSRVFNVLRYWQMIQPYEVDQAEKLIVALQSCGLQQNIHIISKGLDEERLMRVAESIGNKWKIFAGIVFSPSEIHHLLQSTERDQDKALSTLRKWKRKQPAFHSDLKNKLYDELKKCNLVKAARMVFDGLDRFTLYNVARQVMFDMQPLGKALGLTRYEIRESEKFNDPVQSSLAVLKLWNEKNGHDVGRIEKLCDALKHVGLEDAANWLRNLEDDEEDGCDMDFQSQKVAAEASGNPEPEVKAVDRLLLEKIAIQLKERKADISLLKEFLEITIDDSKFEPPNLVFKAEPYLFTLMTWRKKMKHLQRGKQEIGLTLRDSLKKCGLDEAADLISDGTPVDSKGAVGGQPAHDSEQTAENFNVNSMIEFDWGAKLYPGTILWVGRIPDLKDHGTIAGIETEEPLEFGGNSLLFRKMKTLDCDYDKGIFIPLKRCRPDSRFPSESQMKDDFTKLTKEDFGNIECDPIEGYVPPQKEINADRVGMYKGIQGDHNSCYMDVTLYSMFAFNDIFDEILGWPRKSEEDEVQLIKDVLREHIVNPLRWKGVVRADYILHFREMLNELSSMKGLRTEEKDPEEFIHTLLQELLNAKPFLKIRQGENTTMDSFVYQIFLGKQEFLEIPSVEQLVHLSFLESDLKLTEVPECFIVQLPRFGKQFKLYDWIIPSLEMNIAPIVMNSTRPCTVCYKVAFSECKDCRPKRNTGDDIIHSYCGDCWQQRHEKLPRHRPVSVSCDPNFMAEYNYLTNFGQDPKAAENIYDNFRMELFSVMCIETSHYVAFVKTGSGENSQWVFFDSMADRIGDHKGFNVPKVTHLRHFEEIIQSENLTEQLKLPDFHPHIKRLLGDAYICFYRRVKEPKSRCHGNDRSHYQLQNVDQTSHGTFQEPLRREESYHSGRNSSEFPSTESLSSNILLDQKVLKPPEANIAHRQEHNVNWETEVSSGVEQMDCEDSSTYYSNSHHERAPGRLSPNIGARLRRQGSSNSPSESHVAATSPNIKNYPPASHNNTLSVTLQIKQQSQRGHQSSEGNSRHYDPAVDPTDIPRNGTTPDWHTSV